MADAESKQYVLAQRPQGMPKASDFRLETVPMPQARHGEALVRTIYLSIDPYMRGRISGVASYAKGVDPGELMVGGAVGEVMVSNARGLKAGDFVEGPIGWRTHAALPATLLRKLDPAVAPISTANGVIGMPGMTAYFALLDVCQPRPGETVVVSAAAGAVGQVVGQIARINGCRVVGIAGGPEKCAMLTDDLGLDAAVDYKADDWRAQLKAATPDGIDVDFENVGGEIMDAVFARLNIRARVALCGLISGYNDDDAQGPRAFGRILTNRVLIQGFIVLDHFGQAQEVAQAIGGWMAEGRIRAQETVVEGFEELPRAVNMLFDGENVGKLVVKL